ncbi:MAG: hemerythrin domain-containing protein [Burkholderiales bacterium]
MEHAVADRPVARPATPRAAAPARHDVYAFIHKAMRAAMADALVAVGRLDASDARETTAVVARLRDLLDLCHEHLETENSLVHPFMEARRPGSSAKVVDEHVAHAAAIASLRRHVEALARTPAAARAGVARDLYGELALFVGENFVHMHEEETRHNAVLWDAYSDAEIAALEATIRQHVAPAMMQVALHWMRAAGNPGERALLPR